MYKLKDTPTDPRKWPQHATNMYNKYTHMTKELAGKDYLHIDQFMINLYQPDKGLHLHPDSDTQGYIFSVTLGSSCQFKFHMSRERYLCQDKTGFPGEKDEAPMGTWLRKQYTKWLKTSPNADDKMKKEAKDHFVQQLPTGECTPSIVLDLKLKHGDIIMMPGGDFQKYFWHHPSTDKKFGPRINLTGRSIAPADASDDSVLPRGKKTKAIIDEDSAEKKSVAKKRKGNAAKKFNKANALEE